MAGMVGDGIKEIMSQGNKYMDICRNRVWTTFRYDETANKFYDERTGSSLSLPNIEGKSQSGKCVIIEEGTFRSWPCHSPLVCTACKQNHNPTDFYLRGSFSEDADVALDQHFVMEEQHVCGFYSFLGASHNQINFNNLTDQWQLVNLKTGSIVAKMNQHLQIIHWEPTHGWTQKETIAT